MPDYSCDVLAHPRQGQFAAGGLAIRPFKKPARRLRVPDQRVTDWRRAVFLGQFDQAVGGGEIELAFARLHRIRLHGVFRREGVEMPSGQCQLACRLARVTLPAQHGADEKFAFESVFKRRDIGQCFARMLAGCGHVVFIAGMTLGAFCGLALEGDGCPAARQRLSVAKR